MPNERSVSPEVTLPQSVQKTTVARRRPQGGYDVITVERFDSSPSHDYHSLHALEGKTSAHYNSGYLQLIAGVIGLSAGIPLVIDGLRSSDPFKIQTALAFLLSAVSLISIITSLDSLEYRPLLNESQTNHLDGLEKLLEEEATEKNAHPTFEGPTIPDMQAVEALLNPQDENKPLHWPTPQ